MSAFVGTVRSRWSSTDEARRFDVVNPATGAVLAQVYGAGTAEVDQAVNAAAVGQRSWARRTPAERGAVLRRASVAIADHMQELAELESAEMGKPVSQALGFDLFAAVGLFDFFGGLVHAVTGDVRNAGPIMDVTEHHPFGVVASIIPFNWPPIHTAGKAAPALAMGNAMVIKPGEQAPLTVMRLVEIVSSVLPDDALHVVPGDGVTGAALAAHPLVRKLSFTGAPSTGAAVVKSAADNLIPTVLELGGKNPLIVFEDADVDAAVRGIVEGGFFNQGEACTAASRALVHRDVYDEVVKRVGAAVAKFVVGSGADPRTHVGPLDDSGAAEAGARLSPHRSGGRGHDRRSSRAADRPGIGERLLRPADAVRRREAADAGGPGGDLRSRGVGDPFDDEAEAVQIANGTPFGLVAAVYTRDHARGVRVGRQLDAGIVFVNHYQRAGVGVPFGGTKHSGYGREHTLETLREWTYTKTLRLPFGEGEIPQWDALSDVFSPA